MLQICPNLPSQKFIDPQFEEKILTFIRKLGYFENIKSLSDAKVETLPQPWRTFGTIINKCLSGKVTGNDQLRLSRAQILWGMYYQKNIDYVYLLWEDLVYQIKNKVSKKNKDMYCPRLTKVIINHFMEKTDQALKASPGKRLKSTAKVAKSGKKNLPTQGLETLSETTLSKAEQMKVVTKMSKTNYHVSYASGSGAHEGTGGTPSVPNVPTYGSEDEQISWKSSDDENDDEVSKNADNEDDDDHDDDNANKQDDDGQDDDNKQTELDNDGDDFVHPKLSTFDEEERHEENLDEEEEGSDQRFHIPSHFESTSDEAYDESSSVSSGFISKMLNPNPDIDMSIELVLDLDPSLDEPVDLEVFSFGALVDSELLAGPTFELMKGSFKSLVELEYFLEEVCKATTDQLDWNNPEGQQYPHDMRKPLPLIPNS
nr:hypothetical protein [Tanacetum cinerariifolium]